MMTRKTSTTDTEAEIKAAFDVFDSDKCGYIKAEELKGVMSSIGENLTDAEVDEMINLVDTDKDGKISCEYFFYFYLVSWFKEKRSGDGIGNADNSS